MWVTDDWIIDHLKDWVENAIAVDPKTWEFYPDYKAKAQYLNMIMKVKRMYKGQTVINVINAFSKSNDIF